MVQEKKERIFISYKRVDKERVFAIRDGIEQATGEKCWIDLDGIESDAQFANVIIKAINQCEVFLFMYSKEHLEISNFDDDWTIKEITFAKEKKKRIVIVNIDDTPLIDQFLFEFPRKQRIDASDSSALAHLYKDLCTWLKIDVSQKEDVLEEIATQELLLNDHVRESLPETTVREIVKLVLSADGISTEIQESFIRDLKYGLATAQNNLGYMLKDPEKKIKWLEKAAKNGSGAAMLTLGKLYAYGEGVEKNPNKALDYFRAASSNGCHDEAVSCVKELLEEIGDHANHEDLMSGTKIGDLYYEVIDKHLTNLRVVPHKSYKDIHVITIPDTINCLGIEFVVKEIDPYAFANNNSLQTINLPNSLEVIENNAFEGCSSLSSIALPKSIQTIGDGAFKFCSSLKHLEIPSNLESSAKKSLYDYYLRNGIYQPFDDLTSTSIGDSTFDGCSSINSVILKANSIEEFCKERGNNLLHQLGVLGKRTLKINGVEHPHIIIPQGIKYLGQRAFYNFSSLEGVTIPETVEDIAKWAFDGCSSLAVIKYNGTKQQWASINKGVDWNKDIPAEVINCTDGDVKVDRIFRIY